MNRVGYFLIPVLLVFLQSVSAQAGAPPGIAMRFLSSAVPGSTVVLEFTVQGPSQAVTSISFTDNLEATIAGLRATGLPESNVCGAGSMLATDGDGLLTLTGGELAGYELCTFKVTLLVPDTATPGYHYNETSYVTWLPENTDPPSSEFRGSASLLVYPVPVLTKAFYPKNISRGAKSRLSFTVSYPDVSLPASPTRDAGPPDANDVSFTDQLPAGMTIAEPSNVFTTCGGTLSAVAGSDNLSLSGVTISPGGICTIQVEVTSSTLGAALNTSSRLSSSVGSSPEATGTLTVVAGPEFSKIFAADSIVQGGISTLTFTIDNSLRKADTTALAFSDTFPQGITVATSPAVSTTCGGGTLTAAAGATSMSYSGGSVLASATCVVQLDVTSSTVGDHTNISSTLVFNDTVDRIPAIQSTGFSPEATAQLTVTDNTPPVVVAPSDIEMEATGPKTAVSLGDATVTDNVDTGLSATASPTGPFALGLHEVIWTAKDAAGNTGTAIQKVTIVDTTPPEVMPKGENPTMLPAGGSYSEAGATAVDLVDGDLPVDTSGAVDTAVPGTYKITYEATDAKGNKGTAERVVNVGVVRSFTGPLPEGGTGTLSFTSTDPNCTFISAPAPAFQATPASPPLPEGLVTVNGLLSFEIHSCAIGASVMVSMNYGKPLDASTKYYKVGEPWIEIPSSISGNVLMFSLTDGGSGDQDGLANGVITDPGAALKAAPVVVPPQVIPTLGPMALGLMTLFMLLLGGVAIRRYRV